MKHLKMLGLAVVAAAALMALVGAGSASAARICKTNTTPCGSSYPANTTFHETLKTGTKATFAAGLTTIQCEESTVHLETTSAGGGVGANVAVKIIGLSYSKCASAIFEVLRLGSGSVAYTSGMNGSFTGSGTEVKITLGSTKCFYAGEITEGRLIEGGAPAAGNETNVKLVREAGSSALCANPAKWSAEYVFDGETSTAYVSES